MEIHMFSIQLIGFNCSLSITLVLVPSLNVMPVKYDTTIFLQHKKPNAIFLPS